MRTGTEDYDIFGRSLEFDHIFDEDTDIVDFVPEKEEEDVQNIFTTATTTQLEVYSSTTIPISTVQVQNKR